MHQRASNSSTHPLKKETSLALSSVGAGAVAEAGAVAGDGEADGVAAGAGADMAVDGAEPISPYDLFRIRIS